ncbi:TetR/AcrR family transcriptional regulator [Aeromonas caviae]|jgi:AcrR family transcriptional regulator|uniref:TetR/AcrR family transcriptional regulator n=1 Tax=Aeromonas caviae TaxID=648 RepID=UPI000A743CD2|nr:TetR/AcrR family transcriptional regulator [Aeromonas caviae]MDX7709375.1 TetR/AcrR family transcriptional regulator [Aeromonas caviae]MDX7805507.1 TetR/AcrR family transcriptional regulator [Aeromonas caviae]
MTVRRGRPPAYTKELALAALTETFRLNGYAATSLDALVTATRMNRPSLFAAFGNKQAMYLAALDHFKEAAYHRLQPELAAERSLLEDMTVFYECAIELYCDGGALGCLLLSTALSDAPKDEEVRERLRQLVNELESAIQLRVMQAVERENLPDSQQFLVQVFMAQLISLSAQARMGIPKEQLRHAIHHVLSGVLPTHNNTSIKM